MQQVQCSFCQHANAVGISKCSNCGGPLPVASAQPAPQTAGYATAYANPGYTNPAYQAAYQNRAAHAASPSRVTAITAGVIAIFSGLLELLVSVPVLLEFAFVFKFAPFAGVLSLLGPIFGIALVIGAILLFTGKKVGALIVAGGSGLILLFALLGLVGVYPLYGPAHFLNLPVLLLAFSSLTLALVPPTRRWIALKDSSRASIAQAYPRRN